MSDITLYLHSLFVTTRKERILWELRCALVEIQSKTAVKIERMSDTAFYLHSLFVTTRKERIPWELRCALVEIQSKTAVVTTKSIKGPTLFSARASEGLSRNSDLI
ncbi:hypothetical protein V1478_007926 [Vespula squamosa]|uniref:Uncharacterized protein n=1 Tax=Vespula squamosa TaxID=30214 RepID=A0ABD2AXA2_VESSQ